MAESTKINYSNHSKTKSYLGGDLLLLFNTCPANYYLNFFTTFAWLAILTCVHQGTIRMHLLSSQHNGPSKVPWKNFKTKKWSYSGPRSWSRHQINFMLYYHMLHLYIYTCWIHFDAIIKTSDDFFKKIYLPFFERLRVWEGVGDRTELQYIDSHSYGHQLCVFLILQGFSTGGKGATLSAGW